MMALFYIMASVMGSVLYVPSGDAQEINRIYKHPEADMEISASAHWESIYDVDGSGKFRVINRNHNMQISLWYSPTSSAPIEYLMQYADEQGLICTGDPVDTVLNNYNAGCFKAACVSGKVPVRLYLAAIQGDSGLYMIQIKCPEDCFSQHQDQLNQVLSSLRIGG